MLIINYYFLLLSSNKYVLWANLVSQMAQAHQLFKVLAYKNLPQHITYHIYVLQRHITYVCPTTTYYTLNPNALNPKPLEEKTAVSRHKVCSFCYIERSILLEKGLCKSTTEAELFCSNIWTKIVCLNCLVLIAIESRIMHFQ